MATPARLAPPVRAEAFPGGWRVVNRHGKVVAYVLAGERDEQREIARLIAALLNGAAEEGGLPRAPAPP